VDFRRNKMIFVIIILQVTIITSLLVYFGTFNQTASSNTDVVSVMTVTTTSLT